MPNSMSAEPMAGTQRNLADDDKTLTQQTKIPAASNQSHLRIVHSADRVQNPLSVDMSPSARSHQTPNRTSNQPAAMLDRSVQAQIGRMLRDAFSGVAGEPVPERFITLLAELEAKEKNR